MPLFAIGGSLVEFEDVVTCTLRAVALGEGLFKELVESVWGATASLELADDLLGFGVISRID